MRNYVFIPHISGCFLSQISGHVHTQELRRTMEMFLLSLFLLSRCDAEGGLHQLQSCAGELHTRLEVCTNHMVCCQFISTRTPLKLENLTADFPRFLSILFNSITIWGNNALSAFQTASIRTFWEDDDFMSEGKVFRSLEASSYQKTVQVSWKV